MDGIAPLPFVGSHNGADRNRDWYLAIYDGLASLSIQYTSGNISADCVGNDPPNFDQSRLSYPNLWRHFDDLRPRDLPTLSERKSDPLCGGIMSGSLQNLSGLDRVIHEPARLMLVALLSSVESADFLFLLKESGLTKGNLSVHLSRLEEAGYLRVDKTFQGKIPHTEYSLTAKGRTAFSEYRKKLDTIIRRYSRTTKL